MSQFAFMHGIVMECMRRIEEMLEVVVSERTGIPSRPSMSGGTSLSTGLRGDLGDDMDNLDTMIVEGYFEGGGGDEDDEMKETIQ